MSSRFKLLVISEGREVREVSTLDELIQILQDLDEAKIIIVRGEILGILHYLSSTFRKRKPLEEGEGLYRVVAVLDQMFRGFADILLREVDEVEVHEIIGRGLESPVKVGERLYRRPAKDDYDVLKIVEELARDGRRTVIFFTGDKKLAGQVSALGLKNVRVSYMPPNEYPGKESLARAMISELKKLA